MPARDLIIIGITGLPSSGKGVMSSEAKKKGFTELVMGDVIRDEVKKRDLELTRENSNKIMLKLRQERGSNAVALTTLDWVDEAIYQGDTKILIDGIRSMAEVNTIREKYPELKVIAIHADPKTRYTRAKYRKRKDDAYSWDSFVRRDNIELEVGIGDVIALADIMVSSVGKLEHIQEMYADLLDDLIDNHREIGVVNGV